MLKAWVADGSAQDRNFPWVFAGWAEQDGQSDGQNGWSRLQSKPNYQVPHTLLHCVEAILLIQLVWKDRIVLYRLYSFQVIIYLTISNILNVNIFIKVFATSLFIFISLRVRFIQQ